MMRLVILSVISFLLSGYVMAADSVILGSGLPNYFLAIPSCSQDAGFTTICLDADYIWVLESRHTISGPKIAGTIRAVSSQHVAASPDFLKSVELFVLRPIEDPVVRRNSHAAYYLVAVSPRDRSGLYCFSDDPAEFGLKLTDADVVRDGHGRFCFADAALAHRGV